MLAVLISDTQATTKTMKLRETNGKNELEDNKHVLHRYFKSKQNEKGMEKEWLKFWQIPLNGIKERLVFQIFWYEKYMNK